MEYKIGQVFEIDGVWYQFVEDNKDICKGCVFYQSKIKCTNPDEDVKCSKWHREDGKDGHFVRLLPIGDVYEQGGVKWQQYKCVEKPNTEDKRVYIAYTDSEVGLIVSIRLTSSNGIERKIGEIFEFNDEFFQCVESSGCALCAFNETDCNDVGCCEVNSRSDRKSVVFKSLKKIGEPITVKGRTFQKLTSDNNSCKECVFNVPNKACCKNSYIEGICDDNGFWIEIKQNKEDMEEGNNTKHSNSENIGKNLKEFDLEAAKAGKPVCTRDGRKARILCFDRNAVKYHIVALIECKGFPNKEEEIKVYDNDGKYFANGESPHDLMMLPEKKEGWVNIYKGNNGISKYDCDDIVFNTKEEAIQYAQNDDKYITTVKIPWEE